MLFKGFILISFLGMMASCYRMPTDEDFSVVPVTNNKDIIQSKTVEQPAPMPAGKF